MPDAAKRYGKEYRKRKNHEYYKRHYKGATHRKPRTESATCFKCKKPYRATKDQHPRYSLCPKCKMENERIIKDSAWMSGVGIPGKNPLHSDVFSPDHGES